MTRLSGSCSMLARAIERDFAAQRAENLRQRGAHAPVTVRLHPGQHEREGLGIDGRRRPDRRGAHGRPVVRQEILRDRQAVAGSSWCPSAVTASSRTLGCVAGL